MRVREWIYEKSTLLYERDGEKEKEDDSDSAVSVSIING